MLRELYPLVFVIALLQMLTGRVKVTLYSSITATRKQCSCDGRLPSCIWYLADVQQLQLTLQRHHTVRKRSCLRGRLCWIPISIRATSIAIIDIVEVVAKYLIQIEVWFVEVE
jgi:hypothetical protein